MVPTLNLLGGDDFGATLRRHRKVQELTQREVAETLANTPPSTNTTPTITPTHASARWLSPTRSTASHRDTPVTQEVEKRPESVRNDQN